MDKRDSLCRIKQLSDSNGVSGFEDETAALVKNFCEGLGEIREDRMHNVYVRCCGAGKPVVMLDAHTDEVGFMVKSVNADGTLSFIPIGGWVTANIGAHAVRVRNREGAYIPGVISSKPPHFLSNAERAAAPAIEQMSIDVGSNGEDETKRVYKIGIGAPVVPDVSMRYDAAHDTMTGKAFDCRLGCAAMTDVLMELAGCELETELVAAFSAQEEVGSRGAAVTGAAVAPDAAIVFEGCPADDTVVPAHDVQTALRRGPMLRHIDAKMITSPAFQRFALDAIGDAGIPVQEAVRTGGSTNGAPIHLCAAGVPTIVIGIPVRYIHTHYGIATYYDYECSVKAALAVIKALNRETLRAI